MLSIQSCPSTSAETYITITDSETCSVKEKLRSDPECTEETRGNEDAEQVKCVVTKCDAKDEGEDKIDGPPSDIEYPEGSLRGWLVIFGVSLRSETSRLDTRMVTPVFISVLF